MGIYQTGEVVVDRMRPHQKLIVVSVNSNIYSCVPQEHPHVKSLTYFERDLRSDSNKTDSKNIILEKAK